MIAFGVILVAIEGCRYLFGSGYQETNFIIGILCIWFGAEISRLNACLAELRYAINSEKQQLE